MGNNQANAFLKGEGDAYFARNVRASSNINVAEHYIQALADMPLKPERILEIGCGDGENLEKIKNVDAWKGVEMHGIDPSHLAVTRGNERCPALRLQTGTADALPFVSSFFDVVIFGFCLYLCDRASLFTIAAEADRVLKESGRLLIFDFCPPFPYRNTYAHKEGLFSYKMPYAAMWLWNPGYALISHRSLSHAADAFHEDIDERLAVSCLAKLPAERVLLTDPYR